MKKETLFKLLSTEGVGTLPLNQVTKDATLYDLGFDSLRYMELVVHIEEEFNISVPDQMLEITSDMRVSDILNIIPSNLTRE
ncbi:acyl carrier protein [Fictibacillus enclensis]|uniref:acyl carrier protein n=1 Tax=Fictibacillus enclensis TaxID=1017270 RepID=UPI0025A29EDD|nr:acyl carrier protein [Fictibacillus enclensis]MDM5335855.1 acyl carrier protein [Fictibacillus enclensis]